jgi:hypothetical protein
MSGAMNSFFGGKAAAPPVPDTITLDATYTVTSDIAGPNTAGFKLEIDGDVSTEFDGVAGNDVGDWISPKASAPGLYEARATIVSGSVTTGSSATATWLALTSELQWRRLSAAVDVTVTCVLTIEIRLNGGAVLDTSTVTLSATRR